MKTPGKDSSLEGIERYLEERTNEDPTWERILKACRIPWKIPAPEVPRCRVPTRKDIEKELGRKLTPREKNLHIKESLEDINGQYRKFAAAAVVSQVATLLTMVKTNSFPISVGVGMGTCFYGPKVVKEAWNKIRPKFNPVTRYLGEMLFSKMKDGKPTLLGKYFSRGTKGGGASKPNEKKGRTG